MDLQSISWKVENRRYVCLDDFVEDFDTMVNNAFTYNEKDTYYFRMGVKMRETGARAIIAARNALIQSGQEEANLRYLVEFGKTGGQDLKQPKIKDVRFRRFYSSHGRSTGSRRVRAAGRFK